MPALGIAALCLLAAAAVAVAVRLAARRSRRSLRSWTERSTSTRPAELDLSLLGLEPPRQGKVLAVLFTHPQCGGCAPLQRRVENIDEVVTHLVDVSRDPAAAEVCGVDSVPTLVLVDSEGDIVRSWIGTPLAGTLEETVRVAVG